MKISQDANHKNAVLICKKKCYKQLEDAFVLRSQMKHLENSYFQVRRDEIGDGGRCYEENEYEESEVWNSKSTGAVFQVKAEGLEESKAYHDTTSEDPLNKEDYFGDPDLAVSEHHLSDNDETDEEYRACDNKEIRCHQCSRLFSGLQTFNRHVQNVHERKKNFCCEICKRKFFTKYNLEQHLIRHIKNPKGVKEIVIDTSNKNRPFKCEECLRFFKTQAALRQHKTIHTDIRPYACWCGMAFRRNGHLKNHALTHTKKKKRNT